MTSRIQAAALAFATILGLANAAPGQVPAAPTTPKATDTPGIPQEKPATTKTDAVKAGPKLEKATFGGGCFWSFEATFERVPGVRSVTSGFAGGTVPNPTYQMVCTGDTGHAEVIQIEYDASVVSFEKLLDVFWHAHDPTSINSQGDDFGTQYRSIILYQNEAQRVAAVKSHDDLKKRRAFRVPIVTELLPFKAFYPAEPYHQDYFINHPDNEYSTFYIIPKLQKLRKAKIIK